MKRAKSVVVLVLLLTAPAGASKIMKLGENHYQITDQSTTVFSGGGAMQRKVMRVAASLCLGLDYKWFVTGRGAEGRNPGLGKAQGSIEVEYFHDKAEAEEAAEGVGALSPIECAAAGDPKQGAKLAKKVKKP